MKSELVFFRWHFDMGIRLHRRTLIVLVYTGLTLIVSGIFFASRLWPYFATTLWILLLFIPMMVKHFVFCKLIKPFDGNEVLKKLGVEAGPQTQPVAKYLGQIYQNDERDLRRRNEAHWRAYRYIGPAVVIPFGIAIVKQPTVDLRWFSGAGFDALLICLSGALICVYSTLPEAILLWTEPDLEAE